ncbi:hypothetical protein GA0074694_2114 [Micromonospora inyonensis]|uniref:Uncharacterized protein n=1 Tax=Micromonospora inyonensis TaxID=47866 RepID=A0A1C6RKP1_9ACTN|nr:hypothetical protein GA0074694_2114 [Micromonospora inyonensis]
MSHLTRTTIRHPLTGHTPVPELRGRDLITSETAGIGCTPTAAIVGGAR